jgi:hypothetical protein
MVNPVPGHGISTPYGRRGPMWTTLGYHTGADFAAPKGTPVVAAVSGTIRHRNYGSAFGPYQFAISPSKGQPFENDEAFYAHVLDRLPDGTEVTAGQVISHVGDLGNTSGPHLHFEMHSAKGRWAGSVMQNPQPMIDWHPAAPQPSHPDVSQWSHGDVYQNKLHPGQQDSDSVRRLQWVLNQWSFRGGVELPITGNYGPQTSSEVAKFQTQICGDAGDGAIGPHQTDRLFVKGGPWNIVR